MRADSIEYSEDAYQSAVPLEDLQYTPRARMQPIFFAPAPLISGMSWVMGGIPLLTDFSFVLLMIACTVFVVEEFFNFSRRFGLGGITLLFGVLVWFCYDYMTTWFMADFAQSVLPFPPLVIAKSACLHQLFIAFAVVGLHLPMWRWLERLCANLPEPRSHDLYVALIVICFIVGLLPYIFFASDSLPVALWKEITGGRGGGAGFTMGRTGNVNTNWGAYLAQLQQVGQIGALLAIFYAIVLRPGFMVLIPCILIWLLQVGINFGGGARGQTAFMVMPALFLLFLKYQSQAAQMFKRWSAKAYIVGGAVAMLILLLVQLQISYRSIGFSDIHLDDVKTKIEGNSMFSEGLPGMALIPEQSPFFYNRLPGQGALMAMPELAWRFAYGPIPRALWPGKPIDPVWRWYNSVVTGRSEDELEGTTIATGLVGDFYFRFGMAGVIEGGILFGWLCVVGERVLQNSQGRLMQLITSIGFLVFMFR